MCFSSCAPCLLLNGAVTFLQDMLARALRREYSLNLAHPQTVRLLPASCKCGQTQGKEWLAAEGGTPPGSCARSVQVWSTQGQLPFIKIRQNAQSKNYCEDLKSHTAEMSDVYDAINAVQRTPWRVNAFVRELY